MDGWERGGRVELMNIPRGAAATGGLGGASAGAGAGALLASAVLAVAGSGVLLSGLLAALASGTAAYLKSNNVEMDGRKRR